MARIQRMAVTDELTGLYNRRHFFERMEQMLATATRYDQALGLIILDIDNFKLVNDTYGHLVGDLVLRELAECLRQQSRKSDVIARYGGEELVLVLPETDLPGAVHTAEKVRMSLESRDIQLEDGRILRITASFGVAELNALCTLTPGVPINTEKLVEAADAALYRAKHSGRNRVEFA
jgi:diguanylate cyclase (GGDEF)-like protein